MAVESASYPSGLDPSTYGPTGTDDPAEGDNHILLVKNILKNTFANFSGAVTATHTEVNYLDLTALGTAEVSKAITVDASGNCNASAVTFTNLGAVTTVDINGGTVDATPIGASSASTGAFTTLTASGAVTFTSGTLNGIAVGGTTPAAGAFTTLSTTGAATLGSTLTVATSIALATGATVTGFSDDTTLAGDSATESVTEHAVKTYVDARVSHSIINTVIADVSTAETVLIPVPVTGTITAVYSVLEGAITVADATVTLTDSVASAMASLTIAYTGSAAGDVDSDLTITNSAVTAGDYLILATDGGSTGAQRLWVSIVVDTAVG
jgi:hypothetical protein